MQSTKLSKKEASRIILNKSIDIDSGGFLVSNEICHQAMVAAMMFAHFTGRTVSHEPQPRNEAVYFRWSQRFEDLELFSRSIEEFASDE